MNPELEPKAEEDFRKARSLSPEERIAFLERECGDEFLRAKVEELLSLDDEASRDGFLDASAAWLDAPQAEAGVDAVSSGPDKFGQAISIGEVVVPGLSSFQIFLQRRLKVGCLITFAAFLVFLGSDVYDGRQDEPDYRAAFMSHCVVVATAAALSILLWNRRLGIRGLRAVELALLGVGVAFLSLYQAFLFQTLMNGPFWGTTDEEDLIDLTSESCALRWFACIVCYGFFVPNTWERAGRVVGLIVVCPIAVILGLGIRENCVDRLGDLLPDMLIWLGIAAAMAILGSYKIAQLREQAIEARKLGQYQLKQKLGSGGMGEVYLAEHARLRRPCAIKLIRPDHAGLHEALVSFEREVQSTASLTHPNTVRIYDYGVADDETFYYAMEYLAGFTLEQMVAKHGALPASRTVHYLLQVCSALREAHGVGLIHRDIKPGNLIASLLGGVKDQVKLLDFGLVEIVSGVNGSSAGRRSERRAGTPAYMSPEQAAGLGNLDARADIYSLGAVGYFLLAGRPPFAGKSSTDLFLAHLGQPVLPPTNTHGEVPTDVEAVILRCLEKDPSKRFPDAAALEQALAQCGCAGDWTEEDSLRWWGEHPLPDNSSLPGQADLR